MSLEDSAPLNSTQPTNQPKCVNCTEAHPSYSRSCPKWTFEKEIQSLKATQQISYIEARRIVETRTPTVGVSYAAAASKPMRSIATQTVPVCVTMLRIPAPPEGKHFKSMLSPVPSTSKQSPPILTPKSRSPKKSKSTVSPVPPASKQSTPVLTQNSGPTKSQATKQPNSRQKDSSATRSQTANKPDPRIKKKIAQHRLDIRHGNTFKDHLNKLEDKQNRWQLAAEEIYLELHPSESSEEEEELEEEPEPM